MGGFLLSSFVGHIGDRFDLADAAGMGWTLTAAEPLGPVADPATHAAFSLLFHGPADIVVAQQTVTLAHPALGQQAIFVTPIAQDAEGVTYQAIFT